MTRPCLRSSEIDKFLDNCELSSSESEEESDELDRATLDHLFTVDNLFDDDDEIDLPTSGSTGNSSRPSSLVETLTSQNDEIELPVDNVIEHDSVRDIIEQVVRGEIGLSLESPFVWEGGPNEPYNIVFSGKDVGINIPNKEELLTELDVFYTFLGEDFFELVTNETNIYAQQCFEDPTRKTLKTDDKWFDVTVDEMKAFILLSLIMSVVEKPTLQSYWTKRKILETKIFSEVMSLKRYQIIMRFLHFSNNEEANPSDKLGKIRPIIEYIENKFLKNYTPDRDISVDESLMKFRGRLSYIQFIRTKRARFGIKVFKLCESKTGYCSSFEIYTGKKTMPQGVLASEEIVMKLAAPFLDKGYTIYLDNWYSSPSLYSRLLSRYTYAVGTVKMNRKHMPKVDDVELKRGEAIQKNSQGILFIRWVDKKNVNTLSTLHSELDFQPTGKRVRPTKNDPSYEVCKPKLIIDYNNGMQGVDRQDQVLAYNPIMRRYSKGYHKIFFYLFDMVLFNAYVIFSQLKNPKRYHFSDFKVAVAEQMLGTVTLPEKKGTGRPSLSNPMRLQGRHFPETIPATDKKAFPSKKCKVCSDHGLRKEVRVQCKQCKVPLHMDGCFEVFHTVVNY